MKKLLLSLLLLTIVSSVSFAQQGKKGGPDRGRFELPKELNLTAEQQQKVDAINADFKAKFEALRADSSVSREARHEKMKSLNQERIKAINEVLTPEQQAQWKALKEKARKENAGKKDKKDKKQE